VLDGKVVGVGKAGNPDIMDITPGLVVGPNADILSVEGKIATPGFIDIHPHFDSVQQLYEYQSAGFTTVIGGGSGPKTVGIECPGVWNLQRMLEAATSGKAIRLIGSRSSSNYLAARSV
jgi:urease subunit alpha